MHHYLKKRQIEAILRFGDHFYHECFLQYFEGCPRESSFHLNDLVNKVGNDCSLDVIATTANWLKIVSKLVLTKLTKAQP